jgi:hypothetical protein
MTATALRIGFTSIYSWRPHVEHLTFLARLAEKAGHETHFLTCDADLPTCYTRELRGRPGWQECLQCRAGGIRSYTGRRVASIGKLLAGAGELPPVPIEWAQSSASTLGRFESDADYASAAFGERTRQLHPAVQASHAAARRWIERARLDAVCVFNGRMDATRGIFEAAKSLGVRVISVERTWFGDGLQLYPQENCLGLQSVHRLMREWRDRPLTRAQAVRAASYGARRFLRRNDKEWRAYNVGAQAAEWPAAGHGKRRILLVPSSRNEVWGHPDWVSAWGDTIAAYDALIDHVRLAPDELVLRCHPNWGERIGLAGGEMSERHYAEWAAARGIRTIGSRDPASTLGLIEQCDAIVVANGSAALEAGLLGKQVIATAPSIYAEAGLRDDASSPAALCSLRLHAELPDDERRAAQKRLPRQTLRFAYTMVHRVPQYVDAVKAEATTRFRYDFDADPTRFIELLRSGVLRADDEGCAPDTSEEDEVLARIAARDWQGLLDALEPDPAERRPLRRRFPFQPLDAIRQHMPVGDR